MDAFLLPVSPANLTIIPSKRPAMAEGAAQNGSALPAGFPNRAEKGVLTQAHPHGRKAGERGGYRTSPSIVWGPAAIPHLRETQRANRKKRDGQQGG